MPQLITHNIFAKEVFNDLDNNIQKSIHNSIPVYEMYAQSFDTFSCYLTINLKKYKKVKQIGKIAHKRNVKNYFINIINNIVKLNLEQDSDALAYLFGSINHYVLDSTCHPLIFYKTGVYDKKRKKETRKYMGLHGDMENNIDAFYYINRYKRAYHKVNTVKEFIPKINFSNHLSELMDKTFIDTFDIQNASKYYFKAYNNSRIIRKIAFDDRFGIKKTIYKIFDKIIFFRNNNIEYYTTYIKQPKISYLNIEHKKWCYPSDKSITSTESIIDLYNKSLIKAKFLIETAYKVINKEIDIKEFEDVIGNLSYVRGLDCDDSTYMKYFEF